MAPTTTTPRRNLLQATEILQMHTIMVFQQPQVLQQRNAMQITLLNVAFCLFSMTGKRVGFQSALPRLGIITMKSVTFQEIVQKNKRIIMTELNKRLVLKCSVRRIRLISMNQELEQMSIQDIQLGQMRGKNLQQIATLLKLTS